MLVCVRGERETFFFVLQRPQFWRWCKTEQKPLWLLSCPSVYVGGWLIFTWLCLIFMVLFKFFPSWAYSSSWLSCSITFSDTGHVRWSPNKRRLPDSFFFFFVFFNKSCEPVQKVNFCQDFMKWKLKKELSLIDLWADVYHIVGTVEAMQTRLLQIETMLLEFLGNTTPSNSVSSKALSTL